MSSKFSASIEAILDTSLVDKQIKDIGNQKVVLSNLQLDKQSLISSIESALSGHKFSIQIGNINTQNMKSQMEQSGSAAGKAFSQSFGSSLSNINVKNAASSIADLQRTLKGFKFDRSSIDTITNDLESMNLAVKNVKTAISGDSIRVTVNGIDEIGRAVSVVREFNTETGTAQRTGETISQSFDKISEAARRANTELANGTIEASIEKTAASYEKLGTTGHERLSVIKTDIEELRKLQTEMEQATSQEQLVAIYEQFNEVLERTKNNLSTVASVTKQYASANEVATLQNKMEAWLKNNTRAGSKFGSTMQSLIARTQSMTKEGRALRSEFDSVATSFKQVDLAASAMGLKGQTFISSIGNVFRTVTKFVGSYRLIYAAINTVKNGVKDIVSLDTALVDLRKTTDATADELQQFYYAANDTAKALGTTTQEVIQAAAEWSRLGLT